jgi:hypothetical protein
VKSDKLGRFYSGLFSWRILLCGLLVKIRFDVETDKAVRQPHGSAAQLRVLAQEAAEGAQRSNWLRAIAATELAMRWMAMWKKPAFVVVPPKIRLRLVPHGCIPKVAMYPIRLFRFER